MPALGPVCLCVLLCNWGLFPAPTRWSAFVSFPGDHKPVHPGGMPTLTLVPEKVGGRCPGISVPEGNWAAARLFAPSFLCSSCLYPFLPSFSLIISFSLLFFPQFIWICKEIQNEIFGTCLIITVHMVINHGW